MLILLIKSFTTPTDPVAPSRFTLYNPHFLMFYMLSCISASVRCFSYFFTASEWVTSPATEKSFAVIDLLISIIIFFISATTPNELNQGELLDIDDPDEGIMVLHDGRVVRNVSYQRKKSNNDMTRLDWITFISPGTYFELGSKCLAAVKHHVWLDE